MATIRDSYLIAAFDDRRQLDRACDALVRLGVDRDTLRIDDEVDRRTSLRAEMTEEVDHVLAGPGVPPLTKESVRGAYVTITVCSLIALVVFLPFAAIGFGDLAWWWRIGICAAVAVAVGFITGFIIGGGILAGGGPAKKSAAIRGYVLAVPRSERFVMDSLHDAHPIRLDVILPSGKRLRTVETEEDRDERGVLRRTLDELEKDHDDQGPWTTATTSASEDRGRDG